MPVRILRTGLPGIGIDVALGRPVVELRVVRSGAIVGRDVGTSFGRVATDMDY